MAAFLCSPLTCNVIVDSIHFDALRDEETSDESWELLFLAYYNLKDYVQCRRVLGDMLDLGYEGVLMSEAADKVGWNGERISFSVKSESLRNTG